MDEHEASTLFFFETVQKTTCFDLHLQSGIDFLPWETTNETSNSTHKFYIADGNDIIHWVGFLFLPIPSFSLWEI